MNVLLYGIIILFSTQIIFAFGESEIDTDFLLYKGNQYSKLFDYVKAVSFYDKVLYEEPNNVEALYKKGNMLLKLGLSDRAISYFDQALHIDQQNHYAQVGLHNSIVQIASYKIGFLDGVMEIMVHNSEGELVAFQRTENILALEHEITKKFVEQWPVSSIVTQNDQNFTIHQQKFEEIISRDTIIGLHKIPYSEKVDVPVTSTWHYQIPVEKGDVVTYIYSILIPIN